MKNEYTFSGDLDEFKEAHERMCKQVLQNLYSAQDIMCELPENQIELNAIEQAIHALESYGKRFLEDV
jgi:hypothetical protein